MEVVQVNGIVYVKGICTNRRRQKQQKKGPASCGPVLSKGLFHGGVVIVNCLSGGGAHDGQSK